MALNKYLWAIMSCVNSSQKTECRFWVLWQFQLSAWASLMIVPPQTHDCLLSCKICISSSKDDTFKIHFFFINNKSCVFPVSSVHCGLPGSHACGWGLLLRPFALWPCCRSAASSWWCRNQPPLFHFVTHYWSHASEPFFRWPGLQYRLCSPQLQR